jgi:hypothetical protein
MFKQHEKINNLTILKFNNFDKRHRKYYLCKCDCGVKKIIHGSAIRSGNTKSCGCLSTIARKKTRLPNDKAVINQIILGYKRHAKDRRIEWSLTFADVVNLISKNCNYCGINPSNKKVTKNHNGFLYSGIDRVDSSIGYIVNNSVACCNQCNKSKLALSKKDFLNWVTRVYKHQNAMADQWG